MLLGVGDKDSMVGMEETRKVNQSIPSSNMFVLPRSSHPLERTNVSVLLAICRDFLRTKEFFVFLFSIFFYTSTNKNTDFI